MQFPFACHLGFSSQFTLPQSSWLSIWSSVHTPYVLLRVQRHHYSFIVYCSYSHYLYLYLQPHLLPLSASGLLYFFFHDRFSSLLLPGTKIDAVLFILQRYTFLYNYLLKILLYLLYILVKPYKGLYIWKRISLTLFSPL